MAVGVSYDYQRTQTEPRGDEVVDLRDLALVREVHPHGAEHVRHLALEDGGVGVDRAVDAVLVDQAVKKSRSIHSVPMLWALRRYRRFPCARLRSARARSSSVAGSNR